MGSGTILAIVADTVRYSPGMSTMTAPILDLTCDPGPASGRTKAPYPPCIEELESMGTGFAKMSAEIMPQSLVEIATEVVECTRIHTEYYNWQGSDAADITEWVLLRRAASRYKLLTVEVETLQQRARQMALLIFTFSRYRGSWSYRECQDSRDPAQRDSRTAPARLLGWRSA